MANLDIPFAMFAPKNVELEDNDPMVSPFRNTVCTFLAPLIQRPCYSLPWIHFVVFFVGEGVFCFVLFLGDVLILFLKKNKTS